MSMDNPCIKLQGCENSSNPEIALHASLLSLTFSFAIWQLNNFMFWLYKYMLEDGGLKLWLSDQARNILSEKAYKFGYYALQRLHWISYLYTIYASKKMIGNDHAENLYLESMLERRSGLCMFVMDSKKVIIGNVSAMPDPSAPKSESYIRILPYFTGHLCEAHLQLHITTDYTYHLEEQIRGEAHHHYNFDVILPSDNISYAREFDRDFFKKSFIDKTCPCGHVVYNTNQSMGG